MNIFDYPIPKDLQPGLDVVYQAMGELVYLRNVLESMRTEDQGFVERHSLTVAKRMTPTRPRS